jgi:diguanylate cyclase (GGDEF)-like protein
MASADGYVNLDRLRSRVNGAKKLNPHWRLHRAHAYWTFALEVRRSVGRPALESRFGADAIADDARGFSPTRSRVNRPVNIQTDHPRLLILEQDPSILALLMQAFGRPCLVPEGDSSAAELLISSMGDTHFCHCAYESGSTACCIVAKSLAQLRNVDLTNLQVVICGAVLRDADGLDAVAHLRDIRPELPVIFITNDPGLAVQAMRCGAIEVLTPPTEHEIHAIPLAVEKCMALQRIMQDNQRLHLDLKRSLTELTATNHQLQSIIRQLETMARTDELTGLSNRRWFNLMLHGHWAESLRADLPLACLMIDLDNFKSVNDSLGHDAGDDMLRLAAKVIRANCREVDIPSRIGGDEFCILMAGARPDDAAMVAHRILTAFNDAVSHLPADHPRASMSIGVAHAAMSGPTHADQLVTHADEAMYASKGAGKNRVMLRQRKGVGLPGETAPIALPAAAMRESAKLDRADAA